MFKQKLLISDSCIKKVRESQKFFCLLAFFNLTLCGMEVTFHSGKHNLCAMSTRDSGYRSVMRTRSNCFWIVLSHGARVWFCRTESCQRRFFCKKKLSWHPLCDLKRDFKSQAESLVVLSFGILILCFFWSPMGCATGIISNLYRTVIELFFKQTGLRTEPWCPSS